MSTPAFPPLTPPHAEEQEEISDLDSPTSHFRTNHLSTAVAAGLRRPRVGSLPVPAKLTFPSTLPLPGSAVSRNTPQTATPRRLDALSRPQTAEPAQSQPRRPGSPLVRRRSVSDASTPRPRPGWLSTSPNLPRHATSPNLPRNSTSPNLPRHQPALSPRSPRNSPQNSMTAARGIDRPKEAVGFRYSAKYDISIVLLMREFYLEIVADGTPDEQRKAFYIAHRKPDYQGIPPGAFESMLEDAGGKGINFRMLLKFMFPLANKKDLEHMTEVCFPTEDHSKLMERHRRELTELFRRHDVDNSGTLTLAEVMCGLSELQMRHESSSAFGTAEEHSFAMLKDLDRNGDGQISLQEFLESDIVRLLRHRRVPGT